MKTNTPFCINSRIISLNQIGHCDPFRETWGTDIKLRFFKMADLKEPGKVLSEDTMNPNLLSPESVKTYGELFEKVLQIHKDLIQGVEKPFPTLIDALAGDCHLQKQKPITFIRQVLALSSYPTLLETPDFPEDVKSRVRNILDECRGSIGTYSIFTGIKQMRQRIAEYITRRDNGISSDANNIFMSVGASQGLMLLMQFLASNNSRLTGLMLPHPMFPPYRDLARQMGLTMIPYYLDEESGWELSIPELERAVEEGRKVCGPKAIIITNPGNPTGQVLSLSNIQEIIKFAAREKLVIIADEVYQLNVYSSAAKFYSFKKVLSEMGEPYSSVELASIMSASKGYAGECGARGGYCEVVNWDPKVQRHLFALLGPYMCVPVPAQIVLDCIMNPPTEGEPSYELWKQETDQILDGMAVKAKVAVEGFNSIDGLSCTNITGSFYAFARIDMPSKAIQEAMARGQTADMLYTFELLDQAGVCGCPGSLFNQQQGTYHVRFVILAPVDILKDMLQRIKVFHQSFMKKYS